MDGQQLKDRIHQIEQRAAFVDRVVELYQDNGIESCVHCPLADLCNDVISRDEPPAPLCELIAQAAKAMGVEIGYSPGT